MAKLSVVISAFNEEKNIKECLESVNWADEIILVDSGSTDKTVEIAKNYQVKVFPRPNNLMLNVNKNYGFTKASGDWILNLDADERATPELAEEIKATMQQCNNVAMKQVNGYWLPRKNVIFDKWIKSRMWWPDYQLRLFRNGQGQFPKKHVHEKIAVKGETAQLKNPFLHENYSSVSQFLYKMDRIYTENEVGIFLESGKKINWRDSLKWPVADFLKTFFAQEGYKDGLHGLVLSFLQAFYAEVTFIKIWEKQGFKEEELELGEMNKEFKKSGKEINYWLWEIQIRETKNLLKKLLLKLKRKLGNIFDIMI